MQIHDHSSSDIVNQINNLLGYQDLLFIKIDDELYLNPTEVIRKQASEVLGKGQSFKRLEIASVNSKFIYLYANPRNIYEIKTSISENGDLAPEGDWAESVLEHLENKRQELIASAFKNQDLILAVKDIGVRAQTTLKEQISLAPLEDQFRFTIDMRNPNTSGSTQQAESSQNFNGSRPITLSEAVKLLLSSDAMQVNIIESNLYEFIYTVDLNNLRTFKEYIGIQHVNKSSEHSRANRY